MLKTRPFDPAEFIDGPKSEALILADAFDTGDAGYIAHALGVIARARGISEVARQAGVSRPTLYAAISGDGDPKLSTLLSLLKALDVKISVAPKAA
jgi:probable addiction module antidote protein